MFSVHRMTFFMEHAASVNDVIKETPIISEQNISRTRLARVMIFGSQIVSKV